MGAVSGDRQLDIAAQRSTSRVPTWWPCRLLLGKSQSSRRLPRRSSQAAKASRVGSVISNGTGRPVFCWITVERPRGAPPGATSLTRSFPRSQPRSLASIAQLKSARSRTRLADFSYGRMAQTCFGSNGALEPISRPEFQGVRGSLKRSRCMACLHWRSPLPAHKPLGWPSALRQERKLRSVRIADLVGAWRSLESRLGRLGFVGPKARALRRL
jgi:hypothetical protein